MAALGLAIVLATLVPLADASPPDPLWMPGIYDAADSDDLVLAATSLESRVEEGLRGVSHVSIVGGILLTAGPVIPGATLRNTQARAPPRS